VTEDSVPEPRERHVAYDDRVEGDVTTESRKGALARVRSALRGGDGSPSGVPVSDDVSDEDVVGDDFADTVASVSSFLTAHDIDAEYYLAVNVDIRRAGIDPVDHYLRFGMAEGRIFHPALAVEPADGSTVSSDDVSPVFRSDGDSFVLRIVDDRRDLDAYLGPLNREEEVRMASVRFREFLTESGIDATYYIAAHPDIGRSGLDPVEHYLRHGIPEGRLFHPRARLVVSPADQAQPEWEDADAVFRIGTNDYRLFTLPLLEAVDDTVIDQAREQWVHEPSLFAFGLLAVQHLRMVVAGNYPARLEFDVGEFLGLMDGPFGAVVVVSDLASEDALRRTSDLTWAFDRLGMRTLVVCTDAPVEDDRDGVGRGLDGDAVVVDWDRVCRLNRVEMLARLVNALKPEVMLVVEAPTGFDAVVEFGVGLSSVTRLACVYDSAGNLPGGGGTAAKYAGLTAPYACTLTATRTAAGDLEDLWGPVARAAAAVLPQRVAVAGETVMQDRLVDRMTRMAQRAEGRRWLWWSPPDARSVDGSLERLAAARPTDLFDVLVRDGEERPARDCLPVNVRSVGPDDLATSVTEFDGIILADPSAASARMALEMSQCLVPLVLADAAVLREVLDPDAAVFVRPAGADDGSDVVLSDALDHLSRMGPGEVGDLVSRAWASVRERHSDEAYLVGLCDVLGLGDD